MPAGALGTWEDPPSVLVVTGTEGWATGERREKA